MHVNHADMPGFHRQRLAFGPEPDKINPENHKDKSLQGMAVVECVAGLAQGAEQVAGNEDDAKHQHQLASQALEQETKQLNDLLDRLNVYREHSNTVTGFRELVNDNPQFANFYEQILIDQRYRRDPVVAVDMLERYGRELVVGVQIQDLSERITEARTTLQLANDETKARYDYLTQRNQACSNQIDHLSEVGYRLGDDIASIERQLKIIDLADSTRSEGQSLIDTL